MRNNGYLGLSGDSIAHSTTNVPQTSNPRLPRPGQPVSEFERQQAMKSRVNAEMRKLGASPSVVYVLHDARPAEKPTADKSLGFFQAKGIRFSEGGDLLDSNAAGGGIPSWNTRAAVGRGKPYKLSEYRTQLSRIHGHAGPFGG